MAILIDWGPIYLSANIHPVLRCVYFSRIYTILNKCPSNCQIIEMFIIFRYQQFKRIYCFCCRTLTLGVCHRCVLLWGGGGDSWHSKKARH